MKKETIYIIIAVVFLVILLIIYYFYTKRQTELAKEKLAAQQANTGSNVNTLDLLGALKTGLSLFKKDSSTPAPATQPLQQSQMQVNSNAVLKDLKPVQ